jgi:hypothetical protein
MIEGLQGYEFLEGIRTIIGRDPSLPPDQVQTKPLSGSFANVHSAEDVEMLKVSYCLTDNACNHFEAYSNMDVPLSELGCNTFCYIDTITRLYSPSKIYTVKSPPAFYLNCGWETCD